MSARQAFASRSAAERYFAHALRHLPFLDDARKLEWSARTVGTYLQRGAIVIRPQMRFWFGGIPK